MEALNHRVLHRSSSIVLWVMVTLFMLVSFGARAQQVYINEQVRTSDWLSSGQVRSIFTMHQRRWQDGSPIQVFVLSDDNPLHQAFARERLRVFPYRLRQQWDRLTYSGTGSAPTTVPSLEEMRKALQSHPNSIGYLDDEGEVAGLRHIVLKN